MFKFWWFATYGIFMSLMLIVGSNYEQALLVALAYATGGLACWMVNMPNKRKSEMIEKKTSWTAIVQGDPDDPEGAILQFPEDLIEQVGWKEGDEIVWSDNGDGTWTLTKKE
jgi:hypothetical protein